MLTMSNEIIEGDWLIMLCASQSNQSNYSYRWYHNNKELPEENESTLTNTNASLNDSGRYSCSVNNTFMKMVSDEIQINVIRKSPLPLNWKS